MEEVLFTLRNEYNLDVKKLILVKIWNKCLLGDIGAKKKKKKSN